MPSAAVARASRRASSHRTPVDEPDVVVEAEGVGAVADGHPERLVGGGRDRGAPQRDRDVVAGGERPLRHLDRSDAVRVARSRSPSGRVVVGSGSARCGPSRGRRRAGWCPEWPGGVGLSFGHRRSRPVTVVAPAARCWCPAWDSATGPSTRQERVDVAGSSVDCRRDEQHDAAAVICVGLRVEGEIAVWLRPATVRSRPTWCSSDQIARARWSSVGGGSAQMVGWPTNIGTSERGRGAGGGERAGDGPSGDQPASSRLSRSGREPAARPGLPEHREGQRSAGVGQPAWVRLPAREAPQQRVRPQLRVAAAPSPSGRPRSARRPVPDQQRDELRHGRLELGERPRRRCGARPSSGYIARQSAASRRHCGSG